MSHQAQRKEKNCLNCGTEVLGRYCQVCGQENLEPKETFLHLVSHFVNDITHFDGKFFSTLKYLIFRPGFLSAEYVRGRRMSYLHPIRMYVFTSAIFFLAFFAYTEKGGGAEKIISVKDDNVSDYAHLYDARDTLESELARVTDKDDQDDFRESIAGVDKKIRRGSRELARKVAKGEPIVLDTLGLGIRGVRLNWDSLVRAVKNGAIEPEDTVRESNFSFGGEDLPKRVSAYDSMEAAKPPSQRPSWLTRYLNRRLVAVNEHYHRDKNQFIQESRIEVLHTFPKILFVSIPLFAGLLRLLNLRKKRRKQFYYVDHGIFTVHLFCAAFILMLVTMLLQQFQGLAYSKVISYVTGLLFIGIFVYEYIAMLKFYRQGWFKTLVKFLMLNFAASVLIGVITAIFAVWAVLQI